MTKQEIIMFRLINKSSLVVAALGFTVLTGCASTSANNEAAAKPSALGAAMSCPKCETVWVATSTSHGTKIQRYASEKQMTCPDCDKQAAAYIKDGQQILHNCPMCKVAPTPLKPALQPSHPKGTHS
jgi:hypothetical protein